MTARRRVTGWAVAGVCILGALVAGGWEMNTEPSLSCQPLHPELAGADFANGVWVSADGYLIGHALEEDSPIYNDADCV